MATTKQTRAAERNVQKAQKAAARSKTIAHLPSKTKSALGRQGAAVAQRQRSGGSSPKTCGELYEIAKSATCLAGRKWAVTNWPRRSARANAARPGDSSRMLHGGRVKGRQFCLQLSASRVGSPSATGVQR